jgi:alkyl sulfatase BDS1-like metallo-beta-lactamase superfamily hydrolase
MSVLAFRFPRAAVGLVAAALAACSPPSSPPPGAAPESRGEEARPYTRGVVEVAPGVHVAVGFGLANSVLVVGDGAVVVIDTMESAEAATPVRDAFRRISTAPVAAIIFTHNHADHIFGAGVMAGDDHPEVIAHASFQAELDRLVTATRTITYERSMRQFGTLLPAEEFRDCGIGPRLLTGPKSTLSPLLPTRTFEGDRMELAIAGVRMVLLHLPGETPDHVAVWLPEKGVLISGDNYYEAFPNLYTIRGTPYRDVMSWVESLDRMRELRPSVLVPGHTMPVSGADEIHRRLTDYRDAIQFVHDQTVRAMNLGRRPDEIVSDVKLPKSLASRPWLAERYGRVDWSVRAIFDGYLGWFDGDAATLSPLDRVERAKRLASLAGGSEKLRDAATKAAAAGDSRWALELSGHLFALAEFTDVARKVRASALRSLAARETSANGRNYYLTQALEAEERVVVEPPDPTRLPAALLERIPVSDFLRAMTVRLDAQKAEGKSLAVGLRFPDVGEEWGMTLRNGVVELAPRLPANPDMTVTTDSLTWKQVLTRQRNATAAFARGDIQVDRNRLELVRFLFLFR